MNNLELLGRFEQVLDASGVPERLESLAGSSGPTRQIPFRTVMLGILLSVARAKAAHLASAHRILSDLPPAEQLRLGVATTGPDGLQPASYRQFEHSFNVMVRVVDPHPVPSFRGLDEAERSAHLARVRAGVDQQAKADLLSGATAALVEASIPEPLKHRCDLAVDWTDHETWARPREKDDPVPSWDPDASWGHAKRNAPGGRDGPFYGYYAQLAVMVPTDPTDDGPELIRRVVLEGAEDNPVSVMSETLERMHADGIAIGDVLADSGYSFKKGFAPRLRAIGASPVMDLHPFDRGPKGTFEGAVLANGSLYCPAVPDQLLSIGTLCWGAPAKARQGHAAWFAELDAYRLVRTQRPDGDGYERHMCPAAAGKIRCPLVGASLSLGLNKPTVEQAPAAPPRCCRQATITVPPSVNEKSRQRHPWPGPDYLESYKRRTAAERGYGSLADVAGEGVRRGWCRLFGTAKNWLMYALGAVARNLRLIISNERAAKARARKGSMAPLPRPRKRRHAFQPPAPEPVSGAPPAG